MKKMFLFALLSTLFLPVNALVYTVKVPAGTLKCYMTGTINGWKYTEMTQDASDPRKFTLEIATATEEDEYLYCAGPDWAYRENRAPRKPYSAQDEVAAWQPSGWCGASAIAVNGSWYKCSSGIFPKEFNNAELGAVNQLVLTGDLEVYPKSAVAALVWYSINGGEPASFYLNDIYGISSDGNNSKHRGVSPDLLQSLPAGNHKIELWFQAQTGSSIVDKAGGAWPYTAFFTKTTGTGLNDAMEHHSVVLSGNGKRLFAQFEGNVAIEVMTLSGQLLARKWADSSFTMPLETGIYIVKINRKAYKVLVN